jgi:nucleoside 2-deoxyribosyltransferase
MTALKTPKIYLAGKVAKGSEIGSAKDWRSEYINRLSQDGSFEFLSPENPSLDESRPLLVFGHDCYLVRECDILIVDASAKLGVGTAQEMIIAKYFGKYVYTVLPRDTHHRRSNLKMYEFVVEDWVHPFVFAFSDRIFDDINSLAVFFSEKGQMLLDEPLTRLDRIDESIKQYEIFMKNSGINL